MTATIIDMYRDTAKNDADARTQEDAVEYGPAMAEYLGRTHGAPSRLHLGILWGDTPFGDTRPDRMVAVGYSDHYGHVVSQGERNEYGIRTWDYTMH